MKFLDSFEKALNHPSQRLVLMQGAAGWGAIVGFGFILFGLMHLQEGNLLRGIVALLVGSFLAVFYTLLVIAVYRERKKLRNAK